MDSRPFHGGGIVAVAGALPMEVEGLRRLGSFTRARFENTSYMKGDVRGTGVALFISGMGEARAYETARTAFACLPVAAYISVGLSGSLSRELMPGDVVIGERVKTLASGGFGEYRSSTMLLELAKTALALVPRTSVGPLLASEKVVSTAKEKIELMHPYGCLAVDMESAGAARAALQAGVPFITIRAISDALMEDMPVDFNRFAVDGEMDWPRLVFHVATHPGTIAPLVRLGRNSRLAAGNMAQVVGHLLSAMRQQR